MTSAGMNHNVYIVSHVFRPVLEPFRLFQWNKCIGITMMDADWWKIFRDVVDR